MSAQLLQCALTSAVILIAIVLDLRLNSKGRTVVYQLRRLINWLTAGGTYVIFYMARYAIVIINNEDGRAAFGATPSGYGALLTCGFWSYAIGTVLGGGIVDRIGGRFALIVGAAGCSMCCAAAGMLLQWHPNYWALLLLNACNLACATLAALSVIRINGVRLITRQLRTRLRRLQPPSSPQRVGAHHMTPSLSALRVTLSRARSQSTGTPRPSAAPSPASLAS